VHVLEAVVEQLTQDLCVGVDVRLEAGRLGGLERGNARVILREGRASRHCRDSE